MKKETSDLNLPHLFGSGSPTVAERETITFQEAFRLYREYRLAEHNLINYRLTWFCTIQGFLFSVYGFSIQKLSELRANLLLNIMFPKETNFFFHKDAAELKNSQLTDPIIGKLVKLVSSLPIVGMTLSFLVFLGVVAATSALLVLGSRWRKLIAEHRLQSDAKTILPKPGGAGHRWSLFCGLIAPIFIPITVLFAWLYICQ